MHFFFIFDYVRFIFVQYVVTVLQCNPDVKFPSVFWAWIWIKASYIDVTTASPQGNHDDVIKWKHFPCYWPFVWGIHRSPGNSPHKGQWRGALMFSLICVWIKRLSKQSWGWWLETLSCPLWRHYNDGPCNIQNTQSRLLGRFHHNQGTVLLWRCCLTSIWISIIRIRWSPNHLIFTIEISIPEKTILTIYNSPEIQKSLCPAPNTH